jgi:hypothetical protein
MRNEQIRWRQRGRVYQAVESTSKCWKMMWWLATVVQGPCHGAMMLCTSLEMQHISPFPFASVPFMMVCCDAEAGCSAV